jgi:insulysin
MKRMSEIKFRNKDKAQPHTYAIWCSARLAAPAPPQWLLNSNAIYREWDEESVKDVLNCLTPERARLMIIAKQHHDDIVGDNVQWETEKWYGTRYFIKKFEAFFVEKVSSPFFH